MKKIIKKILMILPIFAFIFMTIFSFLGSSENYDPKNENNNLTTELKTLNNNISKKSLVSSNSVSYTYIIYDDMQGSVNIYSDFEYNYHFDETNGDLLLINGYVSFDVYENSNNEGYYEMYYSFDFSDLNGDYINAFNYLNYIDYYVTIVQYQNTNYFIPQINIEIEYGEDYYYYVSTFYAISDNGAFFMPTDYQPNNFSIKPLQFRDYSFSLFNQLTDSVYDSGYDIGFDNGYNDGFDEGIEYQKDLYEQSGNVFDNIWEFLEKGISAVLAVFAIEILPGVPLSICIIVPLVFGIIFFIWKGGAQ